MSAQSYPLHWPPGFPRAKYRDGGQFKTSFDTALGNVQRSLRLFASDSGKKLEHAIMSSNMTLTISAPQDPGVAVWFTWDAMQLCIAVDRYDTPAKNLQAIHHIIEARRVELRHGTLALVRASFAGFKALPAPPGKHWRDILELQDAARIVPTDIETAFKRLAVLRHPDKGGTAEQMSDLNNARDIALKEITPEAPRQWTDARVVDLLTRLRAAESFAGDPLLGEAVEAIEWLMRTLGLTFDFQCSTVDILKTFRAGGLCDAFGKEMVEATREAFDAEDYFNGVPKALCLAAITEAVNADEARKVAGKPKADVAKFAIANVPKTGWLPAELRTAHYDGPIAKKPPAKSKAKKPAKGKRAA